MSVKIELMVAKGLKATVTGQNIKEAIKELNVFSEVPPKCPRCSAPITFKHREVDGNQFFEVVCRGKEEHKSTLGVHRQGDTLYYKSANDWKTFDEIKQESGNSAKPRLNQNQNQKSPPPPTNDGFDDDLPF